jgi:hypothetical protein|tara:strand:+ start:366 stop:596 length:231 start_codon:yes stop_codon:yes gene_type:complete
MLRVFVISMGHHVRLGGVEKHIIVLLKRCPAIERLQDVMTLLAQWGNIQEKIKELNHVVVQMEDGIGPLIIAMWNG